MRKKTPSRSTANTRQKTQTVLEFSDNQRLAELCGEHDNYLERIEEMLDIQILSRGNTLTLQGKRKEVDAAKTALQALWSRTEHHMAIELSDVEAAVRLATTAPHELGGLSTPNHALKIKSRSIAPRTEAQGNYLRTMARHPMVFALGPAGTGKTYLAVAQAVSMLQEGRIEKIILSRPAVEAGERLGFLPGDLREKVDPYLRPLYDALYTMLPAEQVLRHLTTGEIEIAPLAFMRGRTLAHAFIILDEAQNTTPMQMKMALTRIGENSRMVITGDLSQIDLPSNQPSGLIEALETLKGVEGIGIVEFKAKDITRHPLVTRIVEAYDRRAKKTGKPL